MNSSRLAAWLARRNVHYGWVVVGTTFLTMLVTAGAVGAPGVLMLPLQKEFGWQTAEISSALGVRFMLFGLMAPFAAGPGNSHCIRPARRALHAVRPDGAVRGGPDQSLWHAPGCALGTGLDRLRTGALARHDAGVAARVAVGRGHRPRHRHDRAGAGRHGRDALVRDATRPSDRPPHRKLGHRPARVPAAPGPGVRQSRLAHGGGPGLRRARPRHARDARPDA